MSDKVPTMQDRIEGFGWFFFATTLVAIICGAFWFMSPLGIGFAPQPANPLVPQVANTIYVVSYFGGIPMLLLGQVLSAILAALGWRRGAFIVPLVSLGAFALCVTIVLALFR